MIANLDANVSVAKSLSFRSDNSARINLEVSGTESGSNAGANFFIRRYSDAGSLIDTPLTITRSTGAITLATALSGTSAAFSGSLGVGGSATTKFEVIGTIGSFQVANSGAELFFTRNDNNDILATGGTSSSISIGAQSFLRFYTGAGFQERIRIINNGNVGIGTDTPADLLEVKGGFIRLSGTTGNGPQFNLYSNGQTNNHITLAQGFGLATDNIGYLYNRANADFVFGTNNTERLRIAAAGAATFSSSLRATNIGIGFAPQSNINAFVYGVNTNKVLVAQQDGTGLIFEALGQGAVSRMQITQTGSVGIGVSPGYMFHVQGNLSTSQSLFYNTLNSGGDGNLLLRLGSNCNNTGSSYISGGIFGVADKFYIYGNGNMVNANNSYGLLSDIKLKENIVDATPKLEDILKVRIVNYNLISDPEQKQIGVIAQELEEIFPGLIDEHLDKDFEGNLLGTTTKMVKMSIFVPMLIKAMQEQQGQIEELKAKIK